MRSVLYFLSVMALLFMIVQVRGYGQHGTSSNAKQGSNSSAVPTVSISGYHGQADGRIFPSGGSQWRKDCLQSRGKSRLDRSGNLGGQGRLQRTRCSRSSKI